MWMKTQGVPKTAVSFHPGTYRFFSSRNKTKQQRKSHQVDERTRSVKTPVSVSLSYLHPVMDFY
jgi:hypothetical protein